MILFTVDKSKNIVIKSVLQLLRSFLFDINYDVGVPDRKKDNID